MDTIPEAINRFFGVSNLLIFSSGLTWWLIRRKIKPFGK
jgi:hypothetical protein